MIKVFKERYRWATRREKTILLDEFTQVTGLNRCYARTVLRSAPPTNIVKLKIKKKKPPLYDEKVRDALQKIWEILDRVCSKRLVKALAETLRNLEKFQVLKLDKETKKKLLQVSSATIDRLLKPARKKLGRKGTSMTKQPKYLIDKIPIKTFGEWTNPVTGYTQIDLIAHNGGNVFGGFYYTLCATDISTGWTICILVKDKTKLQMLKSLIRMKNTLPFPLLGIHSDNGAEFINETVLAFARKYDIEFTRGRPYKKNDNPHVEQKNYTVVRRNTGYLRLENKEHAAILNELYSYLNLYNNYFLPVMILKEKHRIGSKAIRIYDEPTTPLRRLLKKAEFSQDLKKQLQKEFNNLNLFELKNKINECQSDLVKLAAPIRNSTEKVRVRRRKGIVHTIPKWRRELNSDTSNPFLERQRMEEMRRAGEKVWGQRK